MVLDVSDYGASGVGDSTSAIQTAIDAAVTMGQVNDCVYTVYFPSERYSLSRGLVINGPVALMGDASMRSARLVFTPTQSGPLIDINNISTPQLTGVSIKNLWVASSDTSHNKTGIQINDCSVINIENVEVQFIGEGSRDDVGIYSKGRESTWLDKLRIQASVPIRIGRTLGGKDCDNTNITRCYLISNNPTATLPRASILIDSDCSPSYLTVDGSQALAVADYAVYHKSTSAVRADALVFRNMRFEQGTNSSRHAFHLEYTNNVCERVTISGRVAVPTKGLFARGIVDLNVEDLVRADVARQTREGAMLDIAGCDFVTLGRMQVAHPQGGATAQDYKIENVRKQTQHEWDGQKFPNSSRWMKYRS